MPPIKQHKMITNNTQSTKLGRLALQLSELCNCDIEIYCNYTDEQLIALQHLGIEPAEDEVGYIIKEYHQHYSDREEFDTLEDAVNYLASSIEEILADHAVTTPKLYRVFNSALSNGVSRYMIGQEQELRREVFPTQEEAEEFVQALRAVWKSSNQKALAN